mmetsp:Transcript_160775/g.516019  ORF Transcript_160775/g.516019 Transcript_160775/m.516019 type:complete len:113 (+) Transcript_160775:2669-3007(+)
MVRGAFTTACVQIDLWLVLRMLGALGGSTSDRRALAREIHDFVCLAPQPVPERCAANCVGFHPDAAPGLCPGLRWRFETQTPVPHPWLLHPAPRCIFVGSVPVVGGGWLERR